MGNIFADQRGILMSLTLIENGSIGDSNIEKTMLLADALKNISLTLTNMDSTTVPAIAAGSVVEVGGALLRADTEESISTTDPATGAAVADGTVYICINGATRLAYFTATAPTWSDLKQGWYGTAEMAGYKYIDWQCVKSTTSYTKFKLINILNTRRISVISAIIKDGSNNYIAYPNDFNVTITVPLCPEIDDLSEVANNKITVKKSGFYKIEVSAYIYMLDYNNSSYATCSGMVMIYVDGQLKKKTEPRWFLENNSGWNCSHADTVSLKMITFLNANSYIEFKLKSGSEGGSGTLYSSGISDVMVEQIG